MPVDIGLDSLFQETPTVTPQKRIVQPGDAFENTEFQALVWNCQTLNHAVDKLLFTYSWNKYHQKICDVEWIQVDAIPILCQC